jgi:hypothetical protein
MTETTPGPIGAPVITRHRIPIWRLLGGLLLGILIFAAFLLVFGFLTFNLAGGETIEQIEHQDLFFMILAAVPVVWLGFRTRHYIRTDQRPRAYIRGSAALTVVICIVGFYIFTLIPHRSFDKDNWLRPDRKPLAMAAELVEDKKLIGMNGKQIEQMLGKPAEKNESPNSVRGGVSYEVEDGWKMTIYFESDKVVETELRQPFLGV